MEQACAIAVYNFAVGPIFSNQVYRQIKPVLEHRPKQYVVLLVRLLSRSLGRYKICYGVDFSLHVLFYSYYGRFQSNISRQPLSDEEWVLFCNF